MDEESDREYSTPEGDEYTLPVSDIAPIEATVERVETLAPAYLQQGVGPNLHNEAREEQLAENKEPLLVRVIEDDELSQFERKTVRVAWWGFGIAVLSLVATVCAGIVFYRQFTEMAKQTTILSASFEKQKIDSAASEVTASAQLTILQGQLTQQQAATRLEQRAWISIVGTGLDYRTSDRTGLLNARGIIDIMNSGRSPALNVHMWRCAEVMEHEPSVDSGIRKTPGCSTKRIGVQGPGVPIKMQETDDTQVVVKDSLPVNPEAPGSHLYVWGVITYKDIFGGKYHFTKFCFVSAYPQLTTCKNGNYTYESQKPN
jgi:hypothetical protein